MRLLPILLVLVVSVGGCVQAAGFAKQFCIADSDCVCGGGDTDTGQCYLGNKIYYEMKVNKSFTCADFCGGIGGSLVVKCVEYQCRQAKK